MQREVADDGDAGLVLPLRTSGNQLRWKTAGWPLCRETRFDEAGSPQQFCVVARSSDKLQSYW